MILASETARLLWPQERELITELGAAIEVLRISGMPAYRPELPQHNERHIYKESVPAGLRLVHQDTEQNTSHNRLIVAFGLQTHDLFSHRDLDPQEGFTTKEKRTAAIAGPLLLKLVSQADTEEIQGTIITTGTDVPCETPNQRKVSRADLVNVGSPTLPLFLATTVRLYQEHIILSLEAKRQPLAWEPFLDMQYLVLKSLLAQDLSVPPEKQSKVDGLGPFNRQGMRNAGVLKSRRSVRTPNLFFTRHVSHLTHLVTDIENIKPYMPL